MERGRQKPALSIRHLASDYGMLLYNFPKTLEEILEQTVNRAKEFLNKAEKNESSTLDISESSETGTQTNLEALTIDDTIVEQFRHMNLRRTTALDVLLKLKKTTGEGY
jgi:hypothetical protein